MKELCDPKLLYEYKMEKQMERLPDEVAGDLLGDVREALLNIAKSLNIKDERDFPDDELLSDTAIKGDLLEIDNTENYEELKNLVIDELKKRKFDMASMDLDD